MGHCPDCETEISTVEPSADTAAPSPVQRVWECPQCGAILGVSDRD